ncbi:MAG: hypothetical protein WCI75_02420 [candidate division NC10 bacterium]
MRDPFNINSLAQAAAAAALGDTEHVQASRAANDAGRKFLTEALLRRGVIVRPVGGYGFPTHLRITIGTAEENEKCVAALKAALRA